MDSKMISILAFLIGAGAGSVASYLITKSKYDNLINEAVEEVKQRYNSEKLPVVEKPENKPEPVPDADIKSKANQHKPSIVDYSGISVNQGYEKKEDPVKKDIQIITKDEFDNGEYNNAFLTYFADGVLINDLGDDEVDKELIGEHALTTFGDGEDPDIIYVRNNEYEIDYEITRVKDKFNIDEYTESDEVDTDYDD